MTKFKDFTRPLCIFQVLFTENLILKDLSRQFCIFKYFSSMCEPCMRKRHKTELTCIKSKDEKGSTVNLSLFYM